MNLPLPMPGKVIAVGLNYKDHAAEAGVPIPLAPVLFTKWTTSLIPNGADIILHKGVTQLDWEAEFAVVIGKRASHVSESEALSYVSGYTCMNDVTDREAQTKDGQWVRSKSYDTYGPIGPVIVPASQIPDPHNLKIEARLNGKTMQTSNTSNLIFNIPYLISYISQRVTLEVGDVITTGTPHGVGTFYKPPIFMKDGDVIEIEIEKIGILKNQVVAEK
ncbi:MAG: fumarylacetoacetate hydrolase family protein [Actinomycetes bacterium]|jgi:acylpyruvate hydrolase